jgi:hypothetical protein
VEHDLFRKPVPAFRDHALRGGSGVEGAIVAQSPRDATGTAGRSVFVRINQWFGMTQLIAAD